MKVCRKCLIEKINEEFYKRSINLDGLYSYCKECSKKDFQKIREKNKENYKAKQRLYKEKNRDKISETGKKYYKKNRETCLKKVSIYRESHREIISLKEAVRRLSDEERFEKNRKKHLAWSKNNRERLNEYQKEWYQKNKEKRRAHVVLNRAVIAGKIVRPESCSQCNKACKPDGHHIDYTKPLEVIWFCRTCHSRKSPRTVLK